jgi:hypothetical protein
MLWSIRWVLPALLLASGALYADDGAVSDDYRPGQGWQVPGTDFRLGGYASAVIEKDSHRHWAAAADNLSLFVWWEGEGKLRVFSEFDLERALVYEQGSGLTAGHAYLALERLYADYLYSDRLKLRAGKFITPVGRWNVIHADPLVWTTSRPLATERSFPTNATGVMLYGTLPAIGRDVDYSVYTSLAKDWRPDPQLDPFKDAFGLHLGLPEQGNGEFGFSYVNFEQESATDERRSLVGLDYFHSAGRWEISSEAIYRFSDKGSSFSEKGLFVQVVAPLSERWYAIGRYEWFDPAGTSPAMNIGVAGLAMKLSPATIFKAELSHASNNRLHVPEGFFTSFSILF